MTGSAPSSPTAIPHAPALTPRHAAAQVKRLATSRHHLAMLVALATVTLIAGIGGLYAAFAVTHAAGQARQGVTVGSVDVGGFSVRQLSTVVAGLVDGGRLSVTYLGATVTGQPAAMGVAVDQTATVKAILRADPGASLMSDQKKWATQAVPLSYSLDEAALNTWLITSFGIDQPAPADAETAFDPTAGQFVVTPGHAGVAFELAPLTAAVASWAAQPDAPAAASVELVQRGPRITDDAATHAAEAANQRLGLHFTFSIDGGATYTATPTDIASWIQLTPNTSTNAVALSYPAIVINSQLVDTLARSLGQPGEPRRVVVSHDGDVLAELAPIQPGVVVGDLTETARTVADLLAAGRGSDLLVNATTTSPETVTTQLAPAPTSGRWIDVDLSTQVATLMEGDRLDRSFVVSSGQPETPTPTGRYTVYSKVAMQTMNGYNADGSTYSIPNVPWATWFWGDYGFHAAYWLDESQIGSPQSHGCVNMRLADAKYLYDWAPTGAPVVIHGETPPAPSPAPAATLATASPGP